MMNLLIDTPPDEVAIGEAVYPIETGFRTWVLFELLMQDDSVKPVDKAVAAIDLAFPYGIDGEADAKDVIKAIIWFYTCGRTDKERKLANDNSEKEEDDCYEPHERAYSFDYDDEYIYAAFLQQYGINLVTVRDLHWWEFRAMFKGLDHNCEFAKIMGYRTAKITSDMSKSEKNFLHKMKSIHALPMSQKEYDESNALIEALKNGGDVDSLLKGRHS